MADDWIHQTIFRAVPLRSTLIEKAGDPEHYA